MPDHLGSDMRKTKEENKEEEAIKGEVWCLFGDGEEVQGSRRGDCFGP